MIVRCNSYEATQVSLWILCFRADRNNVAMLTLQCL